MGLSNQSILEQQRLLAKGFIEIEPLNQGRDGWWNIGLHHTSAGKIVHVPGKNFPLIETSPIVVSGLLSDTTGKIALSFCMVQTIPVERVRAEHIRLSETHPKEFSTPRIGRNSAGIIVRQEFNGKSISAEYYEDSQQFRVVADASTDSRGITPFVRTAENLGVIDTGFNDDILLGLFHIAKDLAKIQPNTEQLF